ncbi:MAG: tetratricopeptide repeat protein [Candidatus Eisenbacteria bacterium]
MASSSATRWKLACDACAVTAWVGPALAPRTGHDAWCESCQSAHVVDRAPAGGSRCPRCGAPLYALPRFVELWGELQHLDAVLAAWAGDPQPLAMLLPERPRFVTDLDPPAAHAGDPPARVALLEAVAHGDYRHALTLAADDRGARTQAALAIAHERRGDAPAALACWDAVLGTAVGNDAPRAHLARGSLLARAGRFGAASRDLAQAGDSPAARWNRAALLVHEAVAGAGVALPAAGALLRARAEAGEASPYWSDPTIGRLLWSLLVERASAAGAGPAAPLAESGRAVLRAAESEFEHATFWDRAMILVGWARLGVPDDAARVAAPLARGQSAALLDEPALHGAPLASVTRAVAAARAAMDMGDPVEARHSVAEAFAREDLRRFRLPCAQCERGSIGIDETFEPGEPGESGT